MSKQNKKEVFQPDDRFFRKIMSNVENVQMHLKTFYPEIAEIADLTSLKQQTDESIKSSLKIFRSDIVYRCRLKNLKEHFYFSLIWEHKLQPEESVSIQLGLYIFEFLYKLSKAKDRVIEPIIPLIFYNGKEDWEPKTIHQLFNNYPNFSFFERFLPNFSFLFKNITKEPIEKLLTIELAFFRSAMVAMAHRYKAENLIKQEFSIIFELDDKDELLSFMTYFYAIVERSPRKIKSLFEEISFTTKPEVMSTLAMLLEEGRVKGKIEGKIILSFINLLEFLAKFSGLGITQIAQITKFRQSKIKAFLSFIESNTKSTIDNYIKREFLKNIELNKEEEAQIKELLQTIIQNKAKN